MTSAERLSFAVRLAQTELSAIRPGDLLNLRDDLGKFIHGATDIGIAAMPMEQPWTKDYEIKEFLALQNDVRWTINLLLDLREGPRRRVKAEISGGGWPLVRARYVFTNLDTLGQPGRCLLTPQGTVRDMFLLVLFHTIALSSTARISGCPECGVPFVKVRRQKYCTRRCVNRANLRSWRQTQKGRQQAQSAARHYYEKRVHKKSGPNVKISRKIRKSL